MGERHSKRRGLIYALRRWLRSWKNGVPWHVDIGMLWMLVEAFAIKSHDYRPTALEVHTNNKIGCRTLLHPSERIDI